MSSEKVSQLNIPILKSLSEHPEIKLELNDLIDPVKEKHVALDKKVEKLEERISHSVSYKVLLIAILPAIASIVGLVLHFCK